MTGEKLAVIEKRIERLLGSNGAGLGYAAGRAMQSLLAGLDPGDAATFATAIALAVALTLAGSLIPTARAVRVDPAVAVRAE